MFTAICNLKSKTLESRSGYQPMEAAPAVGATPFHMTPARAPHALTLTRVSRRGDARRARVRAQSTDDSNSKDGCQPVSQAPLQATSVPLRAWGGGRAAAGAAAAARRAAAEAAGEAATLYQLDSSHCYVTPTRPSAVHRTATARGAWGRHYQS